MVVDLVTIDSDSDDIEDEDALLPGAIHQLLFRNKMLPDPDAMKAVRKEAARLESKGTWDKSTVKEVETIKAEAKRIGQKVRLGSLMSICSIVCRSTKDVFDIAVTARKMRGGRLLATKRSQQL